MQIDFCMVEQCWHRRGKGRIAEKLFYCRKCGKSSQQAMQSGLHYVFPALLAPTPQQQSDKHGKEL